MLPNLIREEDGDNGDDNKNNGFIENEKGNNNKYTRL
jgi:hypothetical protein